MKRHKMKQLLALVLGAAALLSGCAAPLAPTSEEAEAVLQTVDKALSETKLATDQPVTAPPTSSEPEPEPEPLPPPSAYQIEGITLINQYPEYPTGCESTAAVMLLRYFGVEMRVSTFIDTYLELGEPFEMRGGLLYGPDPYEAFVGSPRDPGSFGCMAPPIKRALTAATEERFTVLDLTGMELEQICTDYVARDVPVLVWVTMRMLDTYDGVPWYLESGELFHWPANEHCMVLIGYDEASYIFADPMGGQVVSYPKELSALRYEQMGKQALTLEKVV